MARYRRNWSRQNWSSWVTSPAGVAYVSVSGGGGVVGGGGHSGIASAVKGVWSSSSVSSKSVRSAIFAGPGVVPWSPKPATQSSISSMLLSTTKDEVEHVGAPRSDGRIQELAVPVIEAQVGVDHVERAPCSDGSIQECAVPVIEAIEAASVLPSLSAELQASH